jgi:cytochrome oxidase assembly protein ShyY1
MPPVVALTLGLVGAAALVRWCVREVHRINAELDSIRATATTEPIDRAKLPKLKRDPETGEYRPG